MTRGVFALWQLRKIIFYLLYLALLGAGFGGIWVYYKSHSPINEPNRVTLAFEEGHPVVDVGIEDNSWPLGTLIRDRQPGEQTRMPKEILAKPQSKDVPLISIVIDDLGMVRDQTQSLINFKVPLTLSFLPYAPNLGNVTTTARERGHELLVHLPMEPKGNFDPGPHAMLTSSPDHKILSDLNYNLSQFKGYVGINNHMGSAFTENPVGLNLILNEVRVRGLFVLDSKTTQKSLFAKMAARKDIPSMTRDVFLDNEQNVDYILGQLTKLEKLAQERGHAIAIGHPYPETLRALKVWLPTLEAKGIMLVPLSQMMKQKYMRIAQEGQKTLVVGTQ